MSKPKPSLGTLLLAWGLGTAAVTAASVECLDIPLTVFFQDYLDTWWSQFFRHITDLASGYIWYTVAVIGIIAAFIRHKYRGQDPLALARETRAWIFMIVTMATSGTFINLVKILVQRERPRLLFRDGTFGFHPFTFDLDLKDCSFPSGHTQSIWTAMLCLGFIAPQLRPLLFTVAVLVSASRVVISAHFAGDVFAGMYVAFFFTLLWRQWFEKEGISVALWRKQQMVPA